jgi:hypothetical protein
MTAVLVTQPHRNPSSAFRQPLSLSRNAGDTASVLKKLKRVTEDCAYCGDSYKTTPGKSPWANSLTYDHIMPNAANGPKDLTNGMLACEPHNSSRKGVPILNSVLGETGDYTYHYDAQGVNVIPKADNTRLPDDEVAQRRKSFAHYVRFFVENRVRLTPQSPKNSWFTQGAFDNILFPFWGKGPYPTDATARATAYQGRVDQFARIVHEEEPAFCDSGQFKALVLEDYPTAALGTPLDRDPKTALVRALDALHSSGKPLV